MAVRRKYNHGRFISTESTEISDKRVLPGMIVNFYYNAPKAFDKNPNLFVLHTDDTHHHGYNLRYLPENQIKQMFKRVYNFVEPIVENRVEATQPYKRFLMKSKYTPTFADGAFIYRNLKAYTQLKDAYRTYRKDRISNLEVSDVDFEYFGFDVSIDKSATDPYQS